MIGRCGIDAWEDNEESLLKYGEAVSEVQTDGLSREPPMQTVEYCDRCFQNVIEVSLYNARLLC